MNPKNFSDFIKAGQTSIPNLLLSHASALSLNNDELILVIQFKSFFDQGNDFPDIELVAQRMQATSKEVYQLIHHLLQKDLLTLTSETVQGKVLDHYHLDHLYFKLADILEIEEKQKTQLNADQNRQEVFQKIEIEFGRPLSPMELETINLWLAADHYSPEIILLALRESVLNQVYSLKYMDRILLNWEKQNLTTPDQIQKEQHRFQAKKQNTPQVGGPTNSTTSKPKTNIPVFDWSKRNKPSN